LPRLMLSRAATSGTLSSNLSMINSRSLVAATACVLLVVGCSASPGFECLVSVPAVNGAFGVRRIRFAHR
jgi:hypothetical protein